MSGARLALPLVGLFLCAAVPGARAATPLGSVWFATDATVLLSTSVGPQVIGVDDLAGTVVRVSVGSLPPGTNITAYHRLNGGGQLVAFDTSVDLGTFTARPGDVVRFNGSSFELFFDATAAGVPDGVITDAVSADPNGDLLLSFDVTVQLGALTAAPEDLVRFDGDTFSMFFDGSAAGLAPGIGLDAAAYLQSNDHLLLSFDVSGTVGSAVDFDDEDVLEYTPGPNTWELSYDGSAHYAGWVPGDLVALVAFPLLPTPTPTASPLPSGVPSHTATASPPSTLTPQSTPTAPSAATQTATATVAVTSGQTSTATATRTVTSGQTSTATATATPGPPTATAPPGATMTATTGISCPGDCNGDGRVSVNELVLMVNIALGSAPITACEAGDLNHNGAISVNEIVAAVAAALGPCGQ